MIKIICDRCGTEIPKGGRIWDMAWCYRLEAAGELKPESRMEEWNICECCKKEILFSITHEQEEEAVEKPKKKTKRKIDHERIAELHKAGKTNGEIAKEMGVSASTVYYSLADHLEKIPAKNQSPDEGKVLDLYRAGWKVKDICWDIGAEEETVKRIILRAAAEEAAS